MRCGQLPRFGALEGCSNFFFIAKPCGVDETCDAVLHVHQLDVYTPNKRVQRLETHVQSSKDTLQRLLISRPLAAGVTRLKIIITLAAYALSPRHALAKRTCAPCVLRSRRSQCACKRGRSSDQVPVYICSLIMFTSSARGVTTGTGKKRPVNY